MNELSTHATIELAGNLNFNCDNNILRMPRPTQHIPAYS
jgi:hypothetical protein